MKYGKKLSNAFVLKDTLGKKCPLGRPGPPVVARCAVLFPCLWAGLLLGWERVGLMAADRNRGAASGLWHSGLDAFAQVSSLPALCVRRCSQAVIDPTAQWKLMLWKHFCFTLHVICGEDSHLRFDPTASDNCESGSMKLPFTQGH